MSVVLRKKMERAAGLPPSLARNSALWRVLLANTNAWADKAFGLGSTFRVEARRVCLGASINKMLSDAQIAAFDVERSPAIRAIAADQVTVTALAAHRLGVAGEDLAEAPALLKSLAFVRAASHLWNAIADILPGHDADNAPEPSLKVDRHGKALDPLQAYLLVNVASGEIGSGLLVSMVFPLESVMACVRSPEFLETNPRAASVCGRERLENLALDTRVRVDAVVDRMELSLADWYHIEPGQTLMLEGANRRQVGLEVTTALGRVQIGAGEIGAWRSQRAIRMKTLVETGEIRSRLMQSLPGGPEMAGEFSA